ncbi:MAG: polysaccharide deacetylase family protein [Limnochordia bacterium]|jgi:polysaccharide deacetylase family sporulation protein PdaB|nr:polysaccharide deacetylase family protein [Bacillota bacterium]HOB08101.1 polysaccharide deacetylase family protein [Limnochordia bacterium]NLH30417.1 polysaccharide deacetylase family protein [Bacillota bacterium]HPT92426.1 polysaccharide deacetylase family protein [Limnochordia bacterium]HPZ30204.1 polysaccharide deacetylase family protein [Limnochordia bacterium]
MRVYVLKLNFTHVLLLAVFLLLTFSVYHEGIQPMIIQVFNAVSNRLVPIYAVDTPAKKIAVSFDATWGTDLTEEILAILREHEVKTTFFLAGYWVDKYPHYVIRIAEEGHEIGNHSYSHPHMNSLAFDAVVNELERNHAMIRELTGQDPFLFRPPFGEYNNTVIKAADSLGYYTIQWSIDSLDWKNTTADQIYQRVISQAQPGAIVLFHNAAKETPRALRRILPELIAQGYEIVPVSELIYRENYYIDSNGIQHLRKGE